MGLLSGACTQAPGRSLTLSSSSLGPRVALPCLKPGIELGVEAAAPARVCAWEPWVFRVLGNTDVESTLDLHLYFHSLHLKTKLW